MKTISFLAGVLLVAAFAPLSWWPLAILAPCILMWATVNASARQAAACWMAFGVGFFGTGVSWVFISIHTYGFAPVWLAGLLTSLFVLTLAALSAPFGYGLHRLCSQQHLGYYLLGWPLAWIGAEWLRAHLLTGFPWLLLGYAHTHSPFGALAPLGGSWLTGGFSIAFSGLIVYAGGRRRWKLCISGVLIACLFLFAAHQSRPLSPAGSVSVALLQGNVPQEDRWQAVQEHLQLYTDLIEQAPQADILLLPEAAFEIPRPMIDPLLEVLSEEAASKNQSLLIGVLEDYPGGFQNTLVALGNTEGSYAKQRLVPFGEFVPFERWLRGLIAFFDLPMSHAIAGDQMVIFKTPLARLLPTICYEVAFPGLWRGDLHQADVLVSVVNNAWFGESLAPYQQWQMAQFMAKAAGKPLIQASNTGMTGVIDAHGRVIESLPLFKQQTLFVQVPLVEGQTFWAYTGQKHKHKGM